MKIELPNGESILRMEEEVWKLFWAADSGIHKNIMYLKGRNASGQVKFFLELNPGSDEITVWGNPDTRNRTNTVIKIKDLLEAN